MLYLAHHSTWFANSSVQGVRKFNRSWWLGGQRRWSRPEVVSTLRVKVHATMWQLRLWRRVTERVVRCYREEVHIGKACGGIGGAGARGGGDASSG